MFSYIVSSQILKREKSRFVMSFIVYDPISEHLFTEDFVTG